MPTISGGAGWFAKYGLGLLAIWNYRGIGLSWTWDYGGDLVLSAGSRGVFPEIWDVKGLWCY
jgi:hypothetical protein